MVKKFLLSVFLILAGCAGPSTALVYRDRLYVVRFLGPTHEFWYECEREPVQNPPVINCKRVQMNIEDEW